MKMAAQSHPAAELPLEELLALYGYTVSDPQKESCRMSAGMPDVTQEKQRAAAVFCEDDGPAAYDCSSSSAAELLRRLQGRDKVASITASDEESDDNSVPSSKEHKEIMVGSMYQAKIPPLTPHLNREKAYSGEDQLLWTPEALPAHDVEHFLLNAQRLCGQQGAVWTQEATIRDNEQALYELVKCHFNAEEALRRLRFNVKVFTEELCSWSEEECRNFEQGYRVYGKNFHLIQANKVRTRSVGECVEYYYMWKKSERHMYFTQQATRLSRKKFSLQSGGTEDGDQDGEAGDLDGSHSSAGLLTRGSAQLQTPLPPHVDLHRRGRWPPEAQTSHSPFSLKAMTPPPTGSTEQAGPADGELVMSLSDPCGAERPPQLFSQEARGASAPARPLNPPWGEVPRQHLYQLHLRRGAFGAGAPHRLRVELDLPAAPPASRFRTFGGVPHPVPDPPPLLQ